MSAENTSGEARYTDLLPPLSADEYEALKADIAERGCLVAVELDEDGNILDGAHRQRACAELGIKPPTITRRGLDEPEKRAHAIALNLQRRQLDREKRRELHVELRKAGKSLREIADASGVSKSTVAEDVATVQIRTVEGRDGKTRPATRPKPAPVLDFGEAVTRREHERAEKLEAKKAERAQVAQEQRATSEGTGQVAHAEATEWLCGHEAESADLLLTDPPYSTDLEDVAGFASEWLPLALRCLKPTGRAYICIGAYPVELRTYIDLALDSDFTLDPPLVWTYRNTLGPSPARSYKLNWQAILHLYGPEAPPLDCPSMIEHFTVQDITAPDGRHGTREHAWQKPAELAERLIRHSTAPGQRVLDPFAGTGTFIDAAARLGRHGYGCELDRDMLALCAEKELCRAA